jgi:hypothetical protein
MSDSMSSQSSDPRDYEEKAESTPEPRPYSPYVPEYSPSVHVSQKMGLELERIAKVTGGSEESVVEKGIALISIAVKAEQAGLGLAVVDGNGTVMSRIKGITNQIDRAVQGVKQNWDRMTA